MIFSDAQTHSKASESAARPLGPRRPLGPSDCFPHEFFTLFIRHKMLY